MPNATQELTQEQQQAKDQQAERDKQIHNEAIDIAAQIIDHGLKMSVRPADRSDTGWAAAIVRDVAGSLGGTGTVQDKVATRIPFVAKRLKAIGEAITEHVELLEQANRKQFILRQGVLADAPREPMLDLVGPMVKATKTATEQTAKAYTDRELAKKL